MKSYSSLLIGLGICTDTPPATADALNNPPELIKFRGSMFDVFVCLDRSIALTSKNDQNNLKASRMCSLPRQASRIGKIGIENRPRIEYSASQISFSKRRYRQLFYLFNCDKKADRTVKPL